MAYGEIDWDTGDAATGPGYPSRLSIQRNLFHEIGAQRHNFRHHEDALML